MISYLISEFTKGFEAGPLGNPPKPTAWAMDQIKLLPGSGPVIQRAQPPWPSSAPGNKPG